jgi:hypothetical protein
MAGQLQADDAMKVPWLPALAASVASIAVGHLRLRR